MGIRTIGALALLCVVGCHRSSEARRHPPSVAESGRARVERQAKVAEVAPAPLPTALPLVGADGVDADGYPLKSIDRAGFRSLLLAGRYAELTRYFEQLQSDFEADPKKEYWITDAAASFDSAEAELLPLLDAWVAASPQSFAPYLARGAYRVQLGYTRRGGKVAADTPKGDFAAMLDAHKKAWADLEDALRIRPKLVAACSLEIEIFQAASDRKRLTEAAAQAAQICPTCFLFRTRMMHALAPRWGGSFEAMADFARAAPVAKNPRLRFLPAYIDLEKAELLRRDHKLDEALALVEHASSLGEYWSTLLERADLLEQKKDFERARRDAERADALRPQAPEVLFLLARIALDQQRWEAAARALLGGLRIDPTHAEGRRLEPTVVQGLLYDSGQHWKAGRKEDALRTVELALALDPENRQAGGIRNFILAGPGTATTAGEVAQLQAAADAAPNDFRAHQALDYALAKQRRFPEVIEMWTRYLAANPRDGRAHLERGGAYFQLDRRAEAGADAQAACALGVSEGCARAKMIRGN